MRKMNIMENCDVQKSNIKIIHGRKMQRVRESNMNLPCRKSTCYWELVCCIEYSEELISIYFIDFSDNRIFE